MLPDGPRVIDWQRPILGPAHLDLALLLESLGFDRSARGGVVADAPADDRLVYRMRCEWFPRVGRLMTGRSLC
jgi:hypothetical protein